MELLLRPIEEFAYIGPAYLKRLQKLGVRTLGDLFYHFPHRYNDFSNLKKISQIKIGEEVAIQGKIKSITTRRTPRKKMILTEAIIDDESGILRAVWFNQPFIAQNLKKSDQVSLAGLIKSKDGETFLSNPAYEKMKNGGLIHTSGLVPVYPETEGLSSRWLRNILYNLLKEHLLKIQEFLPKEILEREGFPEIKKALFSIHFPKTKEEAKIARFRLAFETLFLIQLILQKQRLKLEKELAPKIIPQPEYIEEFKKSLPFELTDDQKKSLREIFFDLQKSVPMSRLLEGEVGSGKTVVAVLASFITVKNGFQVAVMAPTGILAEQHFREFSRLLRNKKDKEGRPIRVGLLTSEKVASSGQRKISKEGLLEKIKKAKVDILIGTHSLIQEGVKFEKLALVIVDEQHRFGVEQRVKLTKQKETSLVPHFLSMTATPIPRTLALAFYGDLSISQIKELPKGRKDIITKIVSPSKRGQVYEFLRKEVREKKQGFIICPLIEESDALEVKAAKEEFKRLKTKIFPELGLALLHGKMAQKEKERIMREFKNGKIQILVATPVVEVGIDIPKATVIIIEGAERFGLSQLYQFKGRVGRGRFQSHCFLFTESESRKTWERLKALTSSKNAFEIAEKDLEIRGPGDFIGKRQSGIPDAVMEALGNISLLNRAKKEATLYLEKDPEIKKTPLLKARLEEVKEKLSLE